MADCLFCKIIAGDIPAIRRYAPRDLSEKTIIGECATEDDIADLRRRRVATLITTMPPVGPDGLDPSHPARFSSAVIEACMAALLGKRMEHGFTEMFLRRAIRHSQ